jgi:hypothetical protein
VNGFTDHLRTRLVSKSNYGAMADLHNSQITTATAKRFPACCVFTSLYLATASNSRDSSISRLYILSSHPSVQDSAELTLSLDYSILAQTTQKTLAFHCFGSTVSLPRIRRLATGMCLPSRCPEMAPAYRVTA